MNVDKFVLLWLDDILIMVFSIFVLFIKKVVDKFLVGIEKLMIFLVISFKLNDCCCLWNK